MTVSAKYESLVRTMRFADPIYVTRPTLPPLDEYKKSIEIIWASGWLTNAGDYHQRLEEALSRYLDAPHLSLFCNGTVALLVALQALDIDAGEVITTPFTFPATAHVLHWNNLTPVFCDIESGTCNLDPARIEASITDKTRAILPVHVYGNVCDVDAIGEIARRHEIPVVYDAAHAFGVRYRGRSVTDYGDLTMLSFHATKLFTTGEGGALVSHSEATKSRIGFLKNFGIADEETVIGPGINGKMSELHAALGLASLALMDQAIRRRRNLVNVYRRLLEDVPGITIPLRSDDSEHNGSYMPILVDEAAFGISRDALKDLLNACNVFPRKYFYPLCSHYGCYRSLPTSDPALLPVAERVSQEVLCLPIYGTLSQQAVEVVCQIIAEGREAF